MRNGYRVSLLIAACAALSSCSGSMEVIACQTEGRLAFVFGDVPTGLFFGQGAPSPHSISVYMQTDAPWDERVRWHAEHYYGAESESAKRSIIAYGQRLPGFTTVTRPVQLSIGQTYTVSVSAGPDVGFTEFVYSTALPPCREVLHKVKTESSGG